MNDVSIFKLEELSSVQEYVEIGGLRGKKQTQLRNGAYGRDSWAHYQD
jgi:hypothetical protein